MVTPGEVGAMEGARRRAVAAVAAARANLTQSWPATVLWPDAASRGLAAMESALAAVDHLRDSLVESTYDDHEAVLSVVSHYDDIGATRGALEEAAPTPEATYGRAVGAAGDAARRAGEWVKSAMPSLPELPNFKPWLIGGAALVALLAVAWLASSVAKVRRATS